MEQSLTDVPNIYIYLTLTIEVICHQTINNVKSVRSSQNIKHIVKTFLKIFLAFPGGSVVKNPPAVQETWVQSLGQEDPLEKEMATHSSFVAWEIPQTEEPGGLQSMGLQTTNKQLKLITHCLSQIPPAAHHEEKPKATILNTREMRQEEI